MFFIVFLNGMCMQSKKIERKNTGRKRIVSVSVVAFNEYYGEQCFFFPKMFVSGVDITD